MKNRKLILKELFSNDEVSGEWGEELPSETHLLRVRCIRGADIEEAWLNKLHSAPTRYIKNKSISKLLKENDIILEISGGSPTQSTGRAVIITRQLLQHAKDPIVCSNFCRTLRVNNQNDPKYVFYSLQNIYRQGVFFNFEGKTTGIKNLDLKSALKSIPIIYLDFPTQQKIAAVLSALDAKIELNQRINAELESMAKTLYDYWFVQFDFPNEKGKPYKSAGGKMVWNEALKREIPLGWDIQKLNSIFDFQKGIEPGSAEYRSAPITSDYIKFFRVGDVDGNTEIYVDATNRDFTIVAERDVVVTFDASVGKTAFGLNGAISGGFRKIYDRKGKFDNALVYFIFKDERILATIHKYATGSILLHASGSIKHLLIVFDEDIVIQFQVFVKPLFDKMVLNRIESQTLTKLRDWLLPMLMNGQVAVMG